MSKNLILQLNVPNGVEKAKSTFLYIDTMYKESEKFAKRYAEKCNADYYQITDSNSWIHGIGKHVAYQKLKMYDLKDYDRIVFLDSDYIIKDTAPNIFEICDPTKFYACVDETPARQELADQLGIPAEWYFNSGFFHIPRILLDITEAKAIEYMQRKWKYADQGLLNKLMFDFNLKFETLDSAKWNPALSVFGTYADHYAGQGKKKWGTVTY